ncbi:MAG: 30S ribosomal protein S17 [Candidatus Komeilibacteria bacterium]|nr:30S ribosomal protein S17 [Candidatus Komeilibacteria bacterium]
MNDQKEQSNIIINRRRLQGEVVADKMQETAVVTVVTQRMHPKYKKRYKITRRYKCHNPANTYKVGQVVEFEECRPLSKQKRWRIIKKLK